jgi:hypothetical protein
MEISATRMNVKALKARFQISSLNGTAEADTLTRIKNKPTDLLELRNVCVGSIL